MPMAELEQLFRWCDTNGDGKISAEELAFVLRALGAPPGLGEVRRMMDEMDSDRDGFVDLSEFAVFHCGPPPHGADGDKDQEVVSEAKLWEVFRMYDADSNRKILARELHRVLRHRLLLHDPLRHRLLPHDLLFCRWLHSWRRGFPAVLAIDHYGPVKIRASQAINAVDDFDKPIRSSIELVGVRGLEPSAPGATASPAFDLLRLDNGDVCDKYREGCSVKVSYAGVPLAHGSTPGFRLGAEEFRDGGGERDERWGGVPEELFRLMVTIA
ncbi:hypothetical protein E2562_011546 [Oryza meyeriana var. granulata]|uniref:EF-hand domain-containing protein n=1 Tax=Oryza meyeriana var. granulata TaxID=110450 RepID=A0A6G1DV18_9ORYZ|nr:hypothetical protein E2562_011546 [Oryza meyeriana var. granulata]